MAVKKKIKSDVAENAALGANSELLSRYSEAGKQFKVAYDGVDREIGRKLHQGLKGISESKVHPDYQEQNINQQAGFSAEVLDTAKQNADSIKNGSKTRASRTDDLGRVNDIKSDQVTLDEFGNTVKGSEVQIKFLGHDKKGNLEFTKKISGKEYAEHYPDGKFRVPSDQFEPIKSDIKSKIEILEKQSPLTPEKQRQLEYLKKVDKNLKKSAVSKAEAIEARKHPKKVTVRQIAKTSHEAGIEAAKVGVAVGSGIAIITNTIAVIKGEKEPGEAAKDIAKATAISGTVSYGTGYANTALASIMKNSTHGLARSLGKANAPAYIIQTAISTAKSLGRLCNEEITGDEFFLEIGKNGTGLLAATQGAVIGQLLIPIPVVGALVGGLLSTLLCGAIYDCTIGMRALNAEIDAFSSQLSYEIAMLKEYQARLMNLDIDRFSRETRNFAIVTDYLSGDYQAIDFNLMLKLTYEYVGIPCPWGSGSLDAFMADKSKVLTFG
jgi:hypothetical protein